MQKYQLSHVKNLVTNLVPETPETPLSVEVKLPLNISLEKVANAKDQNKVKISTKT